MKPQHFMKGLPTESILLDSRGTLLPDGVSEREVKATGKRYIIATCHYKVDVDGTKEIRTYYTQPNEIKQMLFMSPQGKGYYGISRILEYGAETDYSLNNLSGKWKLENEPAPEPETIELSELPFNERAEA